MFNGDLKCDRCGKWYPVHFFEQCQDGTTCLDCSIMRPIALRMFNVKFVRAIWPMLGEPGIVEGAPRRYCSFCESFRPAKFFGWCRNDHLACCLRCSRETPWFTPLANPVDIRRKAKSKSPRARKRARMILNRQRLQVSSRRTSA